MDGTGQNWHYRRRRHCPSLTQRHHPLTLAGPANNTGRLVADYRGAGLIDLALAIRTGSQHRTGAEFIIHSVEVMESIVRSVASGEAVTLSTRCDRPATIDPAKDTDLIAFTASPFDLAVGTDAQGSHAVTV